jgi:hypothetical protein
MKIVTLDVLGNRMDGWEVNQTYRTDRTVEFEDRQDTRADQEATEAAILKALVDQGELSGTPEDYEAEWTTYCDISIERRTDRRPVLDLTDHGSHLEG